MWFVTFWFWCAVGTPLLHVIIEFVNAMLKPGIMDWIRRVMPETKPTKALSLFLLMLFGWPIVLVLIFIAARKGQSPMEYIAHLREDKAKAKAKIEAALRNKEAALLPLVESSATVAWATTPLAGPYGKMASVHVQAVRFAGKALPAHCVVSTEEVSFLYRVGNDFDVSNATPYGRFMTPEQAVAFAKADEAWLRIRRQDLVKIIVGLVPDHIKFDASVPEK